MEDSHFVQVDEANNEMLQTIKIPKNIQLLNDSLPKPNYNPIKTIQLDRKNFFSTIGGNISEVSDKNHNKLPILTQRKDKVRYLLKERN